MDAGETCDALHESCWQCQIQHGFMCSGAFRRFDKQDHLGMHNQTELCVKGTRMYAWNPAEYIAYYDANVSVPAAGFYTADTCQGFPTPRHFKIQNCSLHPESICHTSDTLLCPIGAICVDLVASFECQCPEGFLALEGGAAACSPHGLDMNIVFIDIFTRANMSRIMNQVDLMLDMLDEMQYAKTMNKTILQYQLTNRITEAGEREWTLILHLPILWLRIDKIMAEIPTLESNVIEILAQDSFQLSLLHFNEAQKNEEVIESSGYDILSYTWIFNDPRGLGWEIKLQILKNTDAIQVLYLSQKDENMNLLASNEADIPCRFPEAPSNISCCLKRFVDIFHVPESLLAYSSCDHDLASLPRLFFSGGISGTQNTSLAQITSETEDDFTVMLFLKLEDVQLFFGREKNTAGKIHLQWFLGVATLKTFQNNYMSIQGSHTNFDFDVQTTFTVQMQMQADNTLAPIIDIQILRVQDSQNGLFHDFARFSVSIAEDNIEFLGPDVIPELSALYKIAYSDSDDHAISTYPCAGYETGVFENIQATNECVFSDQVCRSLLHHSRTSMSFVFPLGVDALSSSLAQYDEGAILTQSLFFDFYMQFRDMSSGLRLLERIRTRSSISRQNMAVLCSEQTLKIQLRDMLQISMVAGLLRNDTDFNNSVTFIENVQKKNDGMVCDANVPDSSCLKSPPVGMGSITFLVLGKPEFFGTSAQIMNKIRMESMFSVYFLSELKKIAVLNLINKNRAFQFLEGETIENTTQLMPSDALLKLCPLHIVPGNFGCISRYEIENGLLDFQTSSLFDFSSDRFANDTFANPDAIDAMLSDWAGYSALGESDFTRESVNQHAKVVIDKFNINDRFKRAYILSPEIPWTKTALQELNISTQIDVVQDVFTFSLVTMDATTHGVYVRPLVHVHIPVSAPISCNLMSAYPYLQNIFVDAYGTILGLNRKQMRVLQNFSSGENAASDRCYFTLEADMPLQHEDRAYGIGGKLAMYLNDPHSTLSKRIYTTISRNLQYLQSITSLTFANASNYQGDAPATVFVNETRQNRRLLTSDQALMQNSEKNNSDFSASLSSRRYMNVNSADKIAELTEELIKNDPNVPEFKPGKSRMAKLQLEVPLDFACIEDEAEQKKAMQEYLQVALQKSSRSSIAAVTPTTIIILGEVDCSNVANRRRLLQNKIEIFTEMVFTPEDTAKEDEEIVIEPTVLLRNLPGNFEFVSIEQLPTLNEDAMVVRDSWGGGPIPELVMGPIVPSAQDTGNGYPKQRLRLLDYTVIFALVVVLFDLIVFMGFTRDLWQSEGVKDTTSYSILLVNP